MRNHVDAHRDGADSAIHLRLNLHLHAWRAFERDVVARVRAAELRLNLLRMDHVDLHFAVHIPLPGHVYARDVSARGKPVGRFSVDLGQNRRHLLGKLVDSPADRLRNHADAFDKANMPRQFTFCNAFVKFFRR